MNLRLETGETYSPDELALLHLEGVGVAPRQAPEVLRAMMAWAVCTAAEAGDDDGKRFLIHAGDAMHRMGLMR
ncbi:MAG TPA: hypothetical protein VLC92_00365 [Rhodocyclaceae bacterium]|nr:hypothetical protein [Rhodocyclaceae bacterium]